MYVRAGLTPSDLYSCHRLLDLLITTTPPLITSPHNSRLNNRLSAVQLVILKVNSCCLFFGSEWELTGDPLPPAQDKGTAYVDMLILKNKFIWSYIAYWSYNENLKIIIKKLNSTEKD